MRAPAAERLRRLRWRLTAIFTAMNTIGLVVLAPLIITLDANRGEDSVTHELDVVNQSVLRLITDDNSTLGLDKIPKDPLYNECPAFLVLPGGALSFPAQASANPCTVMDRPVLEQLATEAVSSGNSLQADRKAVNGDHVRVAAEPFMDSSNRYAGAVVSWTDTESESARHRHLVLVVLIGCAVLIGAAALVGYWLSGRALDKLGRIDEALDALAKARTAMESADAKSMVPRVVLTTSEVLLAAGRIERAAAAADTALELTRESGLHAVAADALLVRARIAGRGGDVAAEQDYLSQAEAAYARMGSPRAARIHAQLAVS